MLVRGGDVLGDSVVDPEADEATNLPSDFVHADKLTTDRRGRDLGDVKLRKEAV